MEPLGILPRMPLVESAAQEAVELAVAMAAAGLVACQAAEVQAPAQRAQSASSGARGALSHQPTRQTCDPPRDTFNNNFNMPASYQTYIAEGTTATFEHK